MLGLIQCLLAWAVVMLAASLFVTAATQLLRRIVGLDRIAVDRFVRCVYSGFRSSNEGPPGPGNEEAWQLGAEQFAEDVLSSAEIRPSMVPVNRVGIQENPEYIDRDDLVA